MSELKSVLTIYSTILGGFYAKTKEFEVAMMKARASIGDETWKRGFSAGEIGGATEAARMEIRAAGIKPVTVAGNFNLAAYVENTDAANNVYKKLRVGIDCFDHQILLSVDLKDDVAQRLISKLYTARPDQFLTISAWPTVVERNGRSFINHAVSVKDENKQEIPASKEFSEHVKKQTDGVQAALSTVGVTDNKTVAAAKVNKRIECHQQLLKRIEKRFAPAEQAA